MMRGDDLKISKCLIEMLTSYERHKSHNCTFVFLEFLQLSEVQTGCQKFRHMSEVTGFFQQEALGWLFLIGLEVLTII
jgi:hypothetical protein